MQCHLPETRGKAAASPMHVIGSISLEFGVLLCEERELLEEGHRRVPMIQRLPPCFWDALGSFGRLWEALGGIGRLWYASESFQRLWKACEGFGRLLKFLGCFECFVRPH